MIVLQLSIFYLHETFETLFLWLRADKRERYLISHDEKLYIETAVPKDAAPEFHCKKESTRDYFISATRFIRSMTESVNS